MKLSLPIFAIVFVGSGWLSTFAQAPPHNPPLKTDPASAAANESADDGSKSSRDEGPGNAWVNQAARRVQAEPALSADIRYRVDSFGHELVGQGSYRQFGIGVEKLLRLEVKIQVGDQAVTRQEICGPQYYWLRRDTPFAPSFLGRVNLRQIRLGISRVGAPSGGDPAGPWIMLGGLPKLLESLDRNFVFEAPRNDELQSTSASGGGKERMEVILLTGRWKKERLAGLTESKSGKQVEPVQLPDVVEVLLGRPDQALPLFPYRISYLKEKKKKKAEGETKEARLSPLMTMELFNVHRKGDIQASEFDYNPGDQEVQDLTAAYLERLDLAQKPR